MHKFVNGVLGIIDTDFLSTNLYKEAIYFHYFTCILLPNQPKIIYFSYAKTC